MAIGLFKRLPPEQVPKILHPKKHDQNGYIEQKSKKKDRKLNTQELSTD